MDQILSKISPIFHDSYRKIMLNPKFDNLVEMNPFFVLFWPINTDTKHRRFSTVPRRENFNKSLILTIHLYTIDMYMKKRRSLSKFSRIYALI
jgi:hypothetical protein